MSSGTRQEEAWKDKEVMTHLREEEELTFEEIGERLGCSGGTAATWMKMHNADEMRAELDVEIPDTKPYTDADLLTELYHEEELSTTDIAAVLDCGTGTVVEWMDRLDIEKRSRSDAQSLARGGSDNIWFRTNPRKGYERVACEKKTILHHRLLAAAYWGLDAIRGMHVHHINHIPWDNRKENMDLIDPSTHSSMHGKMSWLDALRAAEMYREGASSYDIAPTFDVTPGSIIHNVREVNPELIRDTGGAA